MENAPKETCARAQKVQKAGGGGYQFVLPKRSKSGRVQYIFQLPVSGCQLLSGSLATSGLTRSLFGTSHSFAYVSGFHVEKKNLRKMKFFEMVTTWLCDQSEKRCVKKRTNQ